MSIEKRVRMFRAPEEGPAELLEGEELKEAKEDFLNKKIRLEIAEFIASRYEKSGELEKMGASKEEFIENWLNRGWVKKLAEASGMTLEEMEEGIKRQKEEYFKKREEELDDKY